MENIPSREREFSISETKFHTNDQLERVKDVKSSYLTNSNADTESKINFKAENTLVNELNNERSRIKKLFSKLHKCDQNEFNEIVQKEAETLNKIVYRATSPTGEVREMGPGEQREKFDPEELAKLQKNNWKIGVFYEGLDGKLYEIGNSDDQNMRELLGKFLTLYVAYNQMQALAKNQQKKDEKDLIAHSRQSTQTNRRMPLSNPKPHPVKVISHIIIEGMKRKLLPGGRLIELKMNEEIAKEREDEKDEQSKIRLFIFIHKQLRKEQFKAEDVIRNFRKTQI